MHTTRALITGLGLLGVCTLTACGPVQQPPPSTAPVRATKIPSIASQPQPATVTLTVDPPIVTVTETATESATTASVYTPPPTMESAPPRPSENDRDPLPDYVSRSPDAEIRATTSNAVGVVNTYWSGIFAGWEDDAGQPVQWWVPTLLHGDGFYDSANGDPIGCDGTPTPGNASFCTYRGAPSGTASWDMELLREEWMFGPGPIYGTVAHEIAHAAQARFRYDHESGASPAYADTKRTELQADCLAGATIAVAEQDGYLDLTSDQLARIADATRWENPVAGDHGSAEQRNAAFDLGYNGDVETCLYDKGVSPHPEVF